MRGKPIVREDCIGQVLGRWLHGDDIDACTLQNLHKPRELIEDLLL